MYRDFRENEDFLLEGGRGVSLVREGADRGGEGVKRLGGLGGGGFCFCRAVKN